MKLTNETGKLFNQNIKQKNENEQKRYIINTLSCRLKKILIITFYQELGATS